MSNVYFISDPHFGHNNIIKYCNRPFQDVHHMNVEMRRLWNEKVNDDDIVVNLGDVTLCRKPNKQKHTVDTITYLKGKKILVYGNHDTKHMLEYYKEYGWLIFDKLEFDNCLLIHSPYNVEDKFNFVLHGHLHGNILQEKKENVNYYDVGVDANEGYAPLTLAEIVKPETQEMIDNIKKIEDEIRKLYEENINNI